MKKLFGILFLFTISWTPLYASNYALEFDGIDDYVDTGIDQASFGADFTISAWVNPDGAWTNYRSIAGEFLNSGGSQSGVSFGQFWDSNLIFSIGTTTNTNPGVYLDPSNIPTNKWTHVSMVIKSGEYIKVYINGVLAGETNSVGIFNSKNGFTIGRAFNDSQRYFDGKMDEFRIWNDVRTADEITAEMNNELVGNENNLLAYYKLNETSGTTANDSSTNSYTGTLTNFPATPTRPSSSPSTLTIDDATITTTKYDSSIYQFTSTTDGWGITYSISGGTDAAKFSIDSGSGVLIFVDSNDSKTNATYSVEVTATAGALRSTKTYSVVVNNTNRNLAFDGITDSANDFVALPDSLPTAISGTDAITIEYWFKGTEMQSAVRFQDDPARYIVVGHGSGDERSFIISGDSSSVKITASDIHDNTWHHVAMTWQRNTADGFKVYLDGKLYDSADSSDVTLPTISSAGALGRWNLNAGAENMNGSLDEVRI